MDDQDSISAYRPPESPTVSKSSYLSRLFSGDIPLVTTYWVWGVLVGGGGFAILNAIVEANFMQIAVLPYGMFAVSAVFLVAIAFSIFIWIAIWRSAGKYEGDGWGYVARAVVLVCVFAFVAQVIFVVNEDELSDAAYAEEERLINNSLPIMLDDSTRLDSARLTPNEYRYSNTVVNSTVAEVDQDNFVRHMEGILSQSLCAESDTRAALESGVTFTYVYNDAVGDHIADVSLTSDNCK